MFGGVRKMQSLKAPSIPDMLGGRTTKDPGRTLQSSHLRSEGSLAKKQPAFLTKSTKGSGLQVAVW